MITWLPGYFIKTQPHWDVLKSGMYASIPWMFATVSDLIVGGFLVDYLINKGHEPTKVRRSMIVIGLAMGLFIVGVAFTGNPNVALVWLSISLSGLAFFAPIGWSLPALIAPKGSVGTVGGIMNFTNNVMAFVAPTYAGWVVEQTGSFASVFVTAAAILLIGILCYVILLGRIEPIPEPSAR